MFVSFYLQPLFEANQRLGLHKHSLYVNGRSVRQRIEKNSVANELWPGVSPDLLKALHILTRDGAINADSRRKLKQTQHLIRLLQPALDDVIARHGEPTVIDCGAGKAYLGLLLAQTHLSQAGHVINIEQRQELVLRAQEIARQAGIHRATFICSAVETYVPTARVHVVTALHACDTATDDALYLGIRHDADHIVVVPCCQAEVAKQFTGPTPPPLETLFHYPLHRREFGSHLTNVLRTLTLQAHGYQVTVTELTGWEHSLKNEVIVARRIHRHHAPSAAKLSHLLTTFGVEPKLQRLLKTREDLPSSVI